MNKKTAGKGRALKDQREVVLLALLSHEKNDTFSNVLVRRTLDSCPDLSGEERAFIKRLLEGVIERRTELDARIEHFTGRSVSRLHPAVRQLLRMGIYQILYMDAVPDSAACNESVRLAKKHAPSRLSGFVNGVLRNAVREAGSAGNSPGHPELNVRNSVPDWLAEMWEDQLGEAEAVCLMEAFMEIRPVSIRLRSGLTPSEREDLLEQIREAGAQIEEGRWMPEALRLRRTSDLRKLPGFAEGLWTVQDESSMLAVAAAGLRGGETVYDVCAAPGGKSFYAADLLSDPIRLDPDHVPAGASETPVGGGKSDKHGSVHSFDLTKRKTDKIREGAARLRLSNILVEERDARLRFPQDEGAADILLCDLPCSGLGVIGKKRDIKYRASREGIMSLQALQREILASAVHYLRSGGVLMYTTCTISREENEDNAAWIESELGLVPEELTPYLPVGIPGIRGHMLQLLPHVHGTDGFFIARFRKR